VVLGELVPDRADAADATQLAEDHDDHGDGGDALDDELAEVGERVGPQAAEGAVEHGDDAGHDDARVHRHAGEHVEEDRHRRPLGGDVEYLLQRAAPGQRLLGSDVVAAGQVLERRGHPVATAQPVPAGREDESAEAGVDGQRYEGPDVDGDAVAVGDGRIGDEDRGAITGHVVGDARQPPGHLAAAGEVVVDAADALVRPDTDEQHHHEIAAEGDPVQHSHRNS
jgi:hypothetical protein